MKTKKIKKQVRKAGRNAEKELSKLQKIATTKIKSITKTAGKEASKAKDELSQLESKVKDYIRENPEKLFVAAAGIGAFVGALTATLMKRKGKKKR